MDQVLFSADTLYHVIVSTWRWLVKYFCKKPIDVLHQSSNFLVVNKPFDVLINSDDLGKVTVYSQLQKQFPDLVNPKYKFGFRVLHRLDYATSGILAIPLNDQSAKEAGKAFQGRTGVKKYYIALVSGHVSKPLLKIMYPIGDDSRPEWNQIKMCTSQQVYCQASRLAETRLAVISRGIFNGYPVTKVLLNPVTGRRHQLRVHCHEIGHRIVGDFTYSNRKDTDPRRMYLHALRLELNLEIEKIDLETRDPFLEDQILMTEAVNEIRHCYDLLNSADRFEIVQLD